MLLRLEYCHKGLNMNLINNNPICPGRATHGEPMVLVEIISDVSISIFSVRD